MALQEFMAANDVALQDEEIEAYNDALSNTESGNPSTAAAYMAVANDDDALSGAGRQHGLRPSCHVPGGRLPSFFDVATQARVGVV